MSLKNVFLMLVFVLLAAPAGAADLDVTVGAMAVDNADNVEGALVLTPRFLWHERKHYNVEVVLPFIVLPQSSGAPWSNPCDAGLANCPGDLFLGLDSGALDAGPSLGFAPGLEWTFRPRCPVRPSVFVGAGIWYDGGRSTPIGGAFYETGDVLSPLLTFGGAWSWGSAGKGALRLEARGLVLFLDDLDVTADDGSAAVFEGGTVLAVALTAGWTLRF